MLTPNANPTPEHVDSKAANDLQDATVSETIEKSITGEDAPMDYEHPTSPGAIVWFTYPAVLILVLLIGLAVMAWWNAASQAVAP